MFQIITRDVMKLTGSSLDTYIENVHHPISELPDKSNALECAMH